MNNMETAENNTALPQKMYCANHPQRETLLRCNRCEKPICIQCAVQTPTGYRCKECVRGQQKVYDTAQSLDYPLAIVIAVVLSGVGSFIASFTGFLTIFLAPAAGMVVAEAVRWAVRRRRSTLLFRLAAGAAAVGALPLFLIGLFSGQLMSLVWEGIYIFMVASTVYYRLRGIQMR
jgi:hypothetical protein